MWSEALLVSCFLGVSFGATLDLCPEGSSCHSATEKLEATSFEFLSKYSQKEYRSISSLTISNASVNKVDPKLKYLKNLVYLDMSHNGVQISSIPPLHSLKTLILKANNLKHINISLLPPNIEYLDLSDNLLSQIPREWRLLKNLKILDLYKNPIDCDCNNVLNYDRLIKSGITIPKPLTCHSPLKYSGKEVSAVNCSIADIMLYDEPEGSGEVDIFEDPLSERKAHLSLFNEVEEIDNDSLERNTIIDDKDHDLLEAKSTDNPPSVVEVEGSGDDEGSGYGIIVPDSGILGCLENCSTPRPLEEDSSGSPLPSFYDQAKIIFDDLNIFKEVEPSSSTTSSITTTSPSSTEAPVASVPIMVKEPKAVKNKGTKLGVDKDVERVNSNVTTGELERATAVRQNSTAVYAVIGVGLFLVVLIIIAFIKKRKSKRMSKNRRDAEVIPGEEMKPLSKSPITTVNDKKCNVKNASNLPEQIPLINGQNGKPRDDTPKLKSFTPLAHPELPNKEEEDAVQEEIPLQNGIPSPQEPEEVDIRPKVQPELLTPQRERVTIRESEIPDSIPRTPLLVHRQKNSDGEIVTTLVP